MKPKLAEFKHSTNFDLIKELGELRAMKEEYRLLLDEASDPIFAFYPDGRYRYVNEEFARGLGKKRTDITGRHISEFFSKDEADKRFAAVKWVFENGQIKILEVCVPLPEGDHFYVTTVKPILDDRGQVVSVICISKDITERKQAEFALINSEQRSKDLVSKLPVGVLIQTATSEIVLSNQIALNMLGITESQLLGKTSFDPAWNVIHEDGTPFLCDTHPVPVAIKTKSLVSNIVMGVFRPQTHDRVWLLVTADPQLCPDGSVLHVICTFVDITERQRIEAERQVVEGKLLDSVRKLEEKELAKTRFLAAAGHDLRQPIAAANLFVDALKLTSPTPRQSELIVRLDQSMSIFSGLLERLLDISKFDAGLIKPQIASFDLEGLFSWMEQNFAQAALDKKLRFRLYFPMNRSLIVRTDIVLLQSVLMNLVTNAIKFTTRGGILISARQRDDKVLLQIWDSGIGIAAPDLLHIFDEFYQVSNPQRNREAGLGLGLSICQRAMSLLGGKVTCRSHIGRGSVFSLELPLNGKPHKIESLPVNNFPNEAPIQNILREQRVVVVEDDALVADGMLSLLKEMGADVRHFHNAEEALQHEELSLTNFFIVDNALDGKLTGMQFLETLQQRLCSPIRAVIVTGETSSQFIGSIKNCSWPVLHKPIDFSKLLSCLADFS